MKNMDYIFFFFFFFFLFFFVFYFRLKLLVLLCLECLMFLLIFLWCKVFGSSVSLLFCVFLFSIFMVLDSVLALSTLVSSSRRNFTYSNFMVVI